MSSARIGRFIQRNATSFFSRSPEIRMQQKAELCMVDGAMAVLGGCLLAATFARSGHGDIASASLARHVEISRFSCSTARCENLDDSEHDYTLTGYSESESFFQSLEYHRSIFPDYYRRWGDKSGGESVSTQTVSWPRRTPDKSEAPALELDLKFCQRSPNKNDKVKCQDIQFRIASYNILQTDCLSSQQKGFWLLKDLAEQGHPDGMCLYGTFIVTRCRHLFLLVFKYFN
jgi:hypothetical protein